MKYINFDDVVEAINTKNASYKVSGRLSNELSDYITELMDVIYDMDAIYTSDDEDETVAYVIFDPFDNTYRCTNKGFGFFNKDFRNAIFFWTKEAAEKDSHYDKTRNLILSVNLALEDIEENMKKNGEWDE